MIESIIAGIVIFAIVGSALAYIIIAKKKGKKCIGCPDSGACSAKKNGSCCCCGTLSNDEK